jgi:hypothetical protein
MHHVLHANDQTSLRLQERQEHELVATNTEFVDKLAINFAVYSNTNSLLTKTEKCRSLRGARELNPNSFFVHL